MFQNILKQILHHSEILEAVKDDLAAQGYDLQVTVFEDYVQPNEVVESGDFDANYFQHIPYLNSFNEEHGTHLVDAGQVTVESTEAVRQVWLTQGIERQQVTRIHGFLRHHHLNGGPLDQLNNRFVVFDNTGGICPISCSRRQRLQMTLYQVDGRGVP